MVELPRLFLAHPDANSVALRRRDEDEDDFDFESGYLSLQVLCEVAVGRWFSGPATLEYMDGPPNSQVDEGVQCFRIVDDVVRRLAGLTSCEAHDVATKWLEGVRAWSGQEPFAWATDLSRLTQLARRAVDANRAVFLSVLFR
jgi:hypothetical protein